MPASTIKDRLALLAKDNCGLLLLVALLLVFIPIKPVIELFALNIQLNIFFIEPWRILTGHLIHAGWMHLFLNLVNLILLRLVFQEWLRTKKLFIFITYSAFAISIGLWAASSLTSYVGFSGIFHGLLIYLLMAHWEKLKVLFTLAIFFVIGKIVYEQIYGANTTLVEAIGVSVATDAHALGVISGFSFWLFEQSFQKYRASTSR